MTGLFLRAWIWFPVLLLLLCLGNGLLVRRITRGMLTPALVLPTGFALTLLICTFFTYFPALSATAGPVVCAAAAIGLVAELRLHRPRRAIPADAWWPGAAALLAGGTVAAPAFFSWMPTWTGYTRIVDIAFEMDLARQLASVGNKLPPLDSSFHSAVYKLLSIGYPIGSQAALGVSSAVAHLDVPWAYQPFLALVTAMGGLSLWVLLRRVIPSKPLRALAAAVAMLPNLLYGYVLVGGIKEVTTASVLMLTAALLVENLQSRAGRRALVAIAVAVAASFEAFSFGVLPWLGFILAAGVLMSVRESSVRRAVLDWIFIGALAAALAVPSIIEASKLFSIAGHAVGGSVNLGLGNLAYPVPVWSASGVWPTGDFRFPLAHVTAAHVLDVIVFALALVGAVFAATRRSWMLLAFGVAVPVVLVYWIDHTGPWLQFKAFTVTGVLVLTLAFAGIGAFLTRRGWWLRPVVWTTSLLLAGVVMYGNALAYHDSSLAPGARYSDLEAIGKRYAGQGPAFLPAYDEAAGYFLRDENAVELVNLPFVNGIPTVPGYRAPSVPVFSYDLNQIQLSYIQSYRLLIIPASPVASRPPSNWNLVDRTRYFDVWRRDRPAFEVVAHFPFSGSPTERTPQFCSHLAHLVQSAGPGASVAFVPYPVSAGIPLAGSDHSRDWATAGAGLQAHGPGAARVGFSVSDDGAYSFWLLGSVGRPVTLSVDGHRVGWVAYDERYPGQWLRIASVSLRRGEHRLVLQRGGGSLHPGNDDDRDGLEGELQEIAVRRDFGSAGRLEVTPGAAAARVCSAHVGYEWMEVLRPTPARR